MGKRGAKPKFTDEFTDVYCPNQDCKFSSISGKDNIVGKAHIKSKTREFENISVTNVTEYSMIEQTLF